MSFDAWDRWKEDMGGAPHWAGSWMLSHATLRGFCPTALSHTDCPGSSHSPPPELPSCETCSLLVGWRENPALVLDPSSPTKLLLHIAKNEDCHKQQEPFNNKLLLLCWMFYWSNACENLFLIFPGRLGFSAHKTQHSPSLTPPQLIQIAERWGKLRTNCSCIRCFINNVNCCFLLLQSAARGQFLQILSVLSHFSTVTDTEAQPKTRQSHLSQQRHPGKQGFWNPAGKESHSHTPSTFKRPLTTASQHQEKVITGLRDWRKNLLDTRPPELGLFLN